MKRSPLFGSFLCYLISCQIRRCVGEQLVEQVLDFEVEGFTFLARALQVCYAHVAQVVVRKTLPDQKKKNKKTADKKLL